MACLLGRLFIAALLLPAGGRRSVAQRSQARNCSLCRADDLLQRRRSGTVMLTGLPVRGSNRVMVIRTSHNSTPAVCHVGGTLPVPGKPEAGYPVAPSLRSSGTSSARLAATK